MLPPERNPKVSPELDHADIMLLKINNGLTIPADDLSPGGGEKEGSGVKTFEVSFNNLPYYLVFGWSDRPRPLMEEEEYQECFQLIAATPQGTFPGLRGVSGYDLEEQQASDVLKIPPALGDGYLMVEARQVRQLICT